MQLFYLTPAQSQYIVYVTPIHMRLHVHVASTVYIGIYIKAHALPSKLMNYNSLI